jgi:hypothetical protein
MKKLKWILPILILIISSISGFAEESENWDGAFATMGVGARALGMGGAFSTIADDATSTYWNPAGLGFMMKRHVTFMYADLYGLGLINNGYVAYGSPDAGNGAAGFSWIITRAELESRLKHEKMYTENTFMATYARRFSSVVSAGVNAKFLLVSSDLEKGDVVDIGGKGYGVDAGVTVYPDKRFGLSMVVHDLFTQISWDTEDGDNERLPIKFTGGLAFQPLSFMKVAADISGSEENIIKKAAAGVESNVPMAGLDQALLLRAGLIRHLDVKKRFVYTAGVGIGFGVGSIDYAYMVDDEALGNTHRISANIYWE